MEFTKHHFENSEQKIAEEEDNIKYTWKMMKNRKYSNKSNPSKGNEQKKGNLEKKNEKNQVVMPSDDEGNPKKLFDLTLQKFLIQTFKEN